MFVLVACFQLLVLGSTAVASPSTLRVPVDPSVSLSRLDSILASTIEGHLASIGVTKTSTADSSLIPLVRLLPSGVGEGKLFMLDQAFGNITTEEGHTRMHIHIAGSLASASAAAAMPHSWSADVDVELPFAERRNLETNPPRYVHVLSEEGKSFWENTLEPALVILGAGAIVALFFLIRS